MKGLIIDEPWISKILRGEKTWEMRRTLSKIRGRIALIRKGSGQIVGVADVVACNPPVATLDEYAATERFHGIPPARQVQAFTLGWKNSMGSRQFAGVCSTCTIHASIRGGYLGQSCARR
jgi:hypothetical protein